MDQVTQPSNMNLDRSKREEKGRKRLVLDAADYSPEIEFRAFLRSKAANPSNKTTTSSTSPSNAISIPDSEHQQLVNSVAKDVNENTRTPSIVGETETSNSEIGVDSSFASPFPSSSSSSPRTQQKIRRKPSPKDVALPEDEILSTEDESIPIVNLDLLYSNTSSLPPLTLNLSSSLAPRTSTTTSHDHINARPFLSPELGQTVAREGVFPLDREIPISIPPALSLITSPLQSPLESVSSSIDHILPHHHRHQDSIISLNELVFPKEIESIEGGLKRRDSLIAIESSFSRMQDMFDNHLEATNEKLEGEEEWKEGEQNFEGNSITDVMLREESLDELLEAKDSILEALEVESNGISNTQNDVTDVNFETSQASLILAESFADSQLSKPSDPNFEQKVESDPQTFFPTPAPSPISRASELPSIFTLQDTLSTSSIAKPELIQSQSSPTTHNDFSRSGSGSDSEDSSTSTPPRQLYQYRSSIGSVSSDKSSIGSMNLPTPITAISSPIRKTFTSLDILEKTSGRERFDDHIVSNQGSIIETKFDENSVSSGNSSPRPLSRSITAASNRTRGPPPPRPKRLRLPVTIVTSSVEPSSPPLDGSKKVINSNEFTRRSSGSSTGSRSSSPFLRRSSQISIPPTSPPLCPLPETPIQSFPSPTTQSPESENHRSTFTNPFEKHFEISKTNILAPTRVNRTSEMSSILMEDNCSSPAGDDKSRNSESFFYQPPPPRKSSLTSRNSLTIPLDSSDEAITAYYGSGLGFKSPDSAKVITSTPSPIELSSNSPSTSESFGEIDQVNTMTGSDAQVNNDSPFPSSIAPNTNQLASPLTPSDTLSRQNSTTSRSASPELLIPASTATTSLSDSMLANAGLAIGYGAWAGLSTVAAVGSWGWNSLASLPSSFEITQTQKEDSDETEYRRKRREILIPGSFRPITPMPDDEVTEYDQIEVEEVRDEIDGFKDYSKVFPNSGRRSSRGFDSTSTSIETKGEQVVTLKRSSGELAQQVVDSMHSSTASQQEKKHNFIHTSMTHSRESSVSAGSNRTVRSNEYRAPILSPESTPTYFAPPGLDFPPPYHTPISSTSSASTSSIGTNRPPSISPSTISEKSTDKRRSSRSFFGFKSSNKKLESPPPLPSLPLPLSKSVSITSNSSGSNNGDSIRTKVNGVESSIGDAKYVEYFSGRSSARRSSISARISSPDRPKVDAFPTSLASTKSSSSFNTTRRSILRKESSFDNTRKRTVSVPTDISRPELEKTIYSVRFANATQGLGLRSVAENDSTAAGGQSHALKWIGVGNGRYGNLTILTDEASDSMYAEQVTRIRSKWRNFGEERRWADVKID